MKTRTAKPDAPLSQERYMSSREFTELRGVSGVAVAARAAIIANPEKRKLVWWLQGMSLAEGGLRRLADDLLAMFPDRIGTKTMHALGIKSAKMVSSKDASKIRHELGDYGDVRSYDPDAPAPAEKPEPMADFLEQCKRLAKSGRRDDYDNERMMSLEQFLIDLCINPRVQIRTASEGESIDESEAALARERIRALEKETLRTATRPYFKDIIGALLEYKRRHEQAAKENFEPTAISRKIWETLDFALATKNMVLIDGLEGRGKTEAVKAWCELHLGEARFVSLKGITSKTTAFREIAKALGIASSYSRTATEMQARIEDVLQISKLMLCLDEAHFVFNQSQRIYTRPELIDWIDTAICNRKAPIALVTTPQFMVCMTRAAKQVDWNYRQFRRRVRRYVKLAAKNTPADIESVARRMLPGACASALKLVLGYALLSKRDLSAIGDVVDEIKAIQGSDTISKVTFEQVKQAIDEHLLPSDTAFAEALKTTKTNQRRHTTKIEPPHASVSIDLDSPEDATEQPAPARNRAAETSRLPDDLITA